jgi:hypothetical protein
MIKPILSLLPALLLAPLAALHAASEPAPKKPNFVFILVDDMPYAGPERDRQSGARDTAPGSDRETGHGLLPRLHRAVVRAEPCHAYAVRA